MKVLIFSPEKPYTGAESLVTGKLMGSMLNKGWNVDLIYHDTELIYKSDLDALNILNNSHGIKNQFFEILPKWFKSVRFLQKIFLLDSLCWIVKAYFLALKLNKVKNYDLVLSRVMPQYGHLPAFLFSKSKKKKWIANWSDPLPVQKSPKPYGKGFDARVSLLEKTYLKLMVDKANFHSFPSARLMNYYIKYMPKIKKSSFVLPHVVINKECTKKIEKKRNRTEQLVVSHIGGLGLRSPVNLIHAVNAINREHKITLNLKIRFIGFVESNILNLVKDLELDQFFRFDGLKSYDETLIAIQQSDIMLVIEAELEEGIFFPSKVTDYLQYGKPMFSISPKVGVMEDILRTFGGGLSADCKSIESIKEVLIKIISDFDHIKSCEGIYNTSKLQHEFSVKKVVQKLEEVMAKMS